MEKIEAFIVEINGIRLSSHIFLHKEYFPFIKYHIFQQFLQKNSFFFFWLLRSIKVLNKSEKIRKSSRI